MSIKLSEARALLADFSSIHAGTHASSIAYFVFLSLIPMLTLSISLVTLTGLGETEVAEFFSAFVPSTFDEFAKSLISDAFKQSGVALSLSTITLLLTASKGIRALTDGLNAAYGAHEDRSPLMIAAITVGMALVFGILLAAAIYFVFGDTALRALSSIVPGLEHRGSLLNAFTATIMVLLGVLSVAMCYTYLPAGTRRLKTQLPGAVVASLSCVALTIGFHLYVDNFCNFEALYGSIATIALFLFWIFLVAYLLLLGAFLNRLRAARK